MSPRRSAAAARCSALRLFTSTFSFMCLGTNRSQQPDMQQERQSTKATQQQISKKKGLACPSRFPSREDKAKAPTAALTSLEQNADGNVGGSGSSVVQWRALVHVQEITPARERREKRREER